MGSLTLLLVAYAARAEDESVLATLLDEDPEISGYSAYVLDSFSDALGFEADLAQLSIDSRSAMLFRRQNSKIDRVGLSDGATNALQVGGAACTELVGSWWPTNIHVRLAERRQGSTPRASLVFVENNPVIGALAELNPGDTLEQRSVTVGGRVVRETVIMEGAQRIVFRRANGRFSVCSK